MLKERQTEEHMRMRKVGEYSKNGAVEKVQGVSQENESTAEQFHPSALQSIKQDWAPDNKLIKSHK